MKWAPVRWTLITLVGLIVTAAAVLYGGSALVLSQTYDKPTIALRTTESGSAERGDRLADILSCKACHGKHGRVFIDAPSTLGVLIAPDLSRKAATYTDQDLIVLLRAGIRPDGTSVIIMPTDSFSALSDSDVADIIAWLRALKPEAQTETATTSFGPVGRLLALNGGLPISAKMPRDPAPPTTTPTTPQSAHGAYLVKTACMHCHALDEDREIKPGLVVPPVRPMAQSYDIAQFTQLLRTGKAIGDRELELMSEVSREVFSHLTDEEIAAIHAYLNAPTEPPPAETPAVTDQ